MQKGEIETANLNTVLQVALNKNIVSVKWDESEFCLNDRAMKIKNNYDKEIFNGDIGIISKINLEDSKITIKKLILKKSINVCFYIDRLFLILI